MVVIMLVIKMNELICVLIGSSLRELLCGSAMHSLLGHINILFLIFDIIYEKHLYEFSWQHLVIISVHSVTVVTCMFPVFA
jgi:hypothetical protein